MSTPPSSPDEVKLPERHPGQQAQRYLQKSRSGLARKLSHWREEQLARYSLNSAGEPGLVLDLPCRAGRFWPVLAEHGNRVILAADDSPEVIQVAENLCAPEVLKRITTFQASVFSISLNSSAVDCIFCMRLFHHVESYEQRRNILREFHRVSRDTVIISLWVDGNFKSWRRKRLEQRRLAAGQAVRRHNRFVVGKEQIEREFHDAGFEIVTYHDLIPGYAMWRTYVLRKPN
ncbi:MAG: class I SAM-dependent methyltransferase [Pseudomonas sp.]|nr:class I SAM-dependent methyltransferase [Pseudomonas sp.]